MLPAGAALDKLEREGNPRSDALEIRAGKPERRPAVFDRLLAMCPDRYARVLYFDPNVPESD